MTFGPIQKQNNPGQRGSNIFKQYQHDVFFSDHLHEMHSCLEAWAFRGGVFGVHMERSLDWRTCMYMVGLCL
jgi:hypothetical protein